MRLKIILIFLPLFVIIILALLNNIGVCVSKFCPDKNVEVSRFEYEFRDLPTVDEINNAPANPGINPYIYINQVKVNIVTPVCIEKCKPSCKNFEFIKTKYVTVSGNYVDCSCTCSHNE
jgi:hypothetical protein